MATKKFPNVELLDARIASVLNQTIQNSHFEKKVSLEEQQAQKYDRFLRGRQIAFMINDYRSWLRRFIFHHYSQRQFPGLRYEIKWKI